MFYREIESNLKIGLSIPQFAEEMFALTDRNREYLKAWLPWLDKVQKVEDTSEFLQLQLKRFGEGEALHLSIFYKGKIAGVLGYNRLDLINCIGHVGYWLGEEFTGKGIMTKAVTELIHLGFENWPIQKIEIHCADDNMKSRAIPEKLGFQNEGTIRRTAKVYDSHQNHIIYGLLREEYFANQTLNYDSRNSPVVG
jgi:ribosomal-protein-serine acetyltransferase